MNISIKKDNQILITILIDTLYLEVSVRTICNICCLIPSSLLNFFAHVECFKFQAIFDRISAYLLIKIRLDQL